MSWDFLFDRVLTWILLAQLGLILWNQRAMFRPLPRLWPDDAPLVSVLVPARNEERRIGRCLENLVAQDYPSLEIIVLDDGSLDATADIVRNFADDGVKLVAGMPLPEGWSGKNWACHQLSQVAAGQLLCFIDADTVVEPGAVSAAAGVLQEERAGLVSMLPRSDADSLSADVLLPMVTHALLALFPVSLIHNTRTPGLALAFGPFMLMTRAAYAAAGGHAAEPDHIVDDVQLSRRIKATGRRVRIVNGTDLVATRWYDGVGNIWRGFSKNAYGGVGYNPWFGMVVVGVVSPLLLIPFLRVGFGLLSGDVPTVAVWQVALLLAARALTSLLGRDPLWSIPLHPVTVAFWGATLAWSMVLTSTGRTVSWKDRDIPTRPLEQGEI
jgi:chlorobactene glucosyltransferase